MSGAEKRAHTRQAVQLGARVRNAVNAELGATVENLGALGALLSTPDLESALEVGDKVTVTIRNEDGTEIVAEGEILRLEQEFSGGDIRRTFAVRFDQALRA